LVGGSVERKTGATLLLHLSCHFNLNTASRKSGDTFNDITAGEHIYHSCKWFLISFCCM